MAQVSPEELAEMQEQGRARAAARAIEHKAFSEQVAEDEKARKADPPLADSAVALVKDDLVLEVGGPYHFAKAERIRDLYRLKEGQSVVISKIRYNRRGQIRDMPKVGRAPREATSA